jgi:hypothetical protein
MSKGVDISRVLPISQMRGEDEEETAELRSMLERADQYVRSMKWCAGVRTRFFGAGVGGVVAVFLFQLDPEGQADEWIWVIEGDLPTAYLVTDEAPDPVSALTIYCDLMEDWVAAVRSKQSMDEVFPVGVPADEEHAQMLEARVLKLREDVIPFLAKQVALRATPKS